MLAVLAVVLVVLMCATPLFLLLRDIFEAVRRPTPTATARTAAPGPGTAAVEYVASRPVLPLR